MPVPSNVTNEFIAPMKSTIDVDLIDVFDDEFDYDYSDIINSNDYPIELIQQLTSQFNTDDYC